MIVWPEDVAEHTAALAWLHAILTRSDGVARDAGLSNRLLRPRRLLSPSECAASISDAKAMLRTGKDTGNGK